MKDKITKTNNSTIIDGKVYKKGNNELERLFNYLNSRDFINHPEITIENELYSYDYLPDLSLNRDDMYLDMAEIIAKLHNNTSYNKKISPTYISDLYQKFKDNCNYYSNYFNDYFDEHIKTKFYSPSEYIILRNYTLINNYFNITSGLIEKWFQINKDKTTIRHSIIHNNVSIDHFINNSPSYLISWDHFKDDIPFYDIVKLYKTDFQKYDMISMLKCYFENANHDIEEENLCFIMLLLSFDWQEENDEFKRTYNATKFISYINETLKIYSAFN